MAPIVRRWPVEEAAMGLAWRFRRLRASRPLTSIIGSSLPGNALIELVRWCGLGLGVEAVACGIGHVP
jgi:hypothetical protein